jgi:Methyltransferase domain
LAKDINQLSISGLFLRPDEYRTPRSRRNARTTINNIIYRLWYRISGRKPLSGNFVQQNSVLAPQHSGRIADIFFAIQDTVVEKWLHYLPVYDALLTPYIGTDVAMLEIGVWNGGSLDMWRKFFGPDANLFGIDINRECSRFDGKSASVRIGSQDDPKFLRGIVKEMGKLDVVLDDGSHIASHQRASFEALFPLLSEGGLYIIEDLHAAYYPHMEGGWRRAGSAIEFLKDMIDDMHRHYIEPGRNNSESLPPIESIQFFDSIAVVRKRRQLPRAHVITPMLQD